MKHRSISCLGKPQKRRWRRQLGWLLCFVLLQLAVATRPSSAHGGVVIDSGFTPHFEWLVSIDPYPIRTGQALITLLVFDLADYKPVDDLQVQVMGAAPNTTRPCCNPAELSEPTALVIDPALYPGDYSAVIPLDQPGEWALQFVVGGGERSFTVIVPVAVAAAPPGQESVISLTPDVAATATVFAQNVQQARQQNSPLPVSPLPAGSNPDMAAAAISMPGATTFWGVPWWLWAALALIPIFMGWLLLRAPQSASDELEDDEAEGDEAAEDKAADAAAADVSDSDNGSKL